jgi:hypothetical protein
MLIKIENYRTSLKGLEVIAKVQIDSEKLLAKFRLYTDDQAKKA